jgi:hypothetical protein
MSFFDIPFFIVISGFFIVSSCFACYYYRIAKRSERDIEFLVDQIQGYEDQLQRLESRDRLRMAREK